MKTREELIDEIKELKDFYFGLISDANTWSNIYPAGSHMSLTYLDRVNERSCFVEQLDEILENVE